MPILIKKFAEYDSGFNDFAWTGTGISKQGNKVRFEGIDVFDVNEAGKIRRLYAYWNPAEMVAQL